MSNQEKFDQILGLLGQYKRPKTLDWLIGFIKKDIEKRVKDNAQYNEYYQKNREKRDSYHREYRKNHPEYEERRRERARLNKQK